MLLACSAGLASQADPEASGPPRLTARRVDSVPVVDGRLDEEGWESAAGVSEFFQREPAEGQPATESTRVRVLYGRAHLYIGAELSDREPNAIRASELRRDNGLESDDAFAVVIDSFHDHRNAFLFRVNPLGTRYDAVIRNESSTIDSTWDEQWTAAAVLGEGGWTVEMAIPFKILRFSGAGEQVWGINFERVIKRKNESAYWAGWSRNFGLHHVSQAGHLTGLTEIRQVERLRIRPYVVVGGEDLNASASPGAQWIREVGIDDLKFALTPNLVSDLTINPDFGQVEVDAQQVNLTRFSLFFREKRQFFVEGADELKMGLGLLHFGPPPLELFHSRRIGLSETGQPVPILFGGKMTGKLQGVNLGVLNVQTDDHEQLPGENFTVARVRKEMLGRSYVGGIFTNREGGGKSNRVLGLDARFVFKKYMNVMGILAKSFQPGVTGKNWVKHLGAEWRADLVTAGAIVMDIDPDFDPGIGFVRRRQRMAGGRAIFKPRPGGEWIRNFEITPSLVYFHDEERVLKSREGDFRFAIDFQSGDRLQFDFENTVENLSNPFRIGRGVVLPVGRYEWNAGGASFQSFNGRRLDVEAGFTAGDFYSGSRRSLTLGATIRPTEKTSFSSSYDLNDIELREGSFNTHLFSLRANVSFTNNLLTSTFLQYNSTGDLAAIQVRLNYIFRNIDNFFVVYNETRFTDGVFSGESNRSLILKLTYSLHR